MRYLWIIWVLFILGCSPENANNKIGSFNMDYANSQQEEQATSMAGMPSAPTAPAPIYNPQSIEELQPGLVDAGETCGSVEVDADVEVIEQDGNVLVVFDRSASMNEPWGTVPRYQAAGQAIIDAITPLQDSLIVGGIFFPSMPNAQSEACNVANPIHWIPGPDAACLNLVSVSCDVTDISSADQISFRPAPEFITELPNHWILLGAGMTPLEGGVTRADEAITSAGLTGGIAVVIMTDGEPNCNTIPQNVENVVAKWHSNGIKTYVVGLPGSNAAQGILSNLAIAGGTQTFLEPDDPAALQAELAKIAGETIRTGISSCTINLVQEENANLADLHLVVTENGVAKDVPKQISGGGWDVTPDGSVATLQGSLCTDATTGRFSAVRFDFGCVELPILLE